MAGCLVIIFAFYVTVKELMFNASSGIWLFVAILPMLYSYFGFMQFMIRDYDEDSMTILRRGLGYFIASYLVWTATDMLIPTTFTHLGIQNEFGRAVFTVFIALCFACAF